MGEEGTETGVGGASRRVFTASSSIRSVCLTFEFSFCTLAALRHRPRQYHQRLSLSSCIQQMLKASVRWSARRRIFSMSPPCWNGSRMSSAPCACHVSETVCFRSWIGVAGGGGYRIWRGP
jgi:hypothetical protein